MLRVAHTSAMITALWRAALLLDPVDARAQSGDAGSGFEVPRASEDDGPRRWRLDTGGPHPVREAPSPEARVLDHLTDGAVVANLGCEAAEGRVWCAVKALEGNTRGFVALDSLIPAKGPDGAVLTGINDSPTRAKRGDFDSRAKIACAQIQGQPLGTCDASAAQSGGGDATVVVTFSNGFSRTLFFVHGRFTRANATMSGVGTDMDWQRDAGLISIRVDNQRFELPEQLVFGD